MEPRERDSLLEINDQSAHEIPDEAPPRSRLSILSGAALVTLALTGWTQRPRTVDSEVTASDASDLSKEVAQMPLIGGLDFSLRTKDYQHKAPGKGYRHLTHGKMAEPHRATTLSLFHSNGKALSDTATTTAAAGAPTSCSWTASFVSGGGVYDELPANLAKPAHSWSANGHILPGASSTYEATITFPAPGKYRINAECAYEIAENSHASASVASPTTTSASEVITVAYVRRELRKLTKKDRDAYLDTFLLLYRTPTVTGQATYGIHYQSLSDLQMMHLSAATDRREDHLHDGMGFLTQHVAMTMAFELSLQSVQPHLAVPYWDFTVDWAFVADSSEDASGRSKDTSLIFSSGSLFHNNFFGTTDDTEHTVVDGRMGHLVVPRDFSAATHSPYGFARAPWNINPSKYVTRYHSLCGVKGYGQGLDWPSCSNHFKMAHSSDYDSWDAYVWELSYGPHGPVHAWTGGVGGQCDTFAELDTLAELKGTSLAKALSTSLRASAFNLLKFAWRELAIEMPSTCSADTPASECMWSCHDGADTALETLLASSFLHGFPAEVWEDDIKDIVKKVICETPFWPGEHLDAGSPLEASFWPVHPGLDRLTQYKALVQPFKDEAWPSANSTHTDVCSTLHYPHMHDGDSSSDPGADAVTAAPYCLGHHATDLTYWPSVSADATTGSYTKTYLTNGEVLSATSPSAKYSAPYIYEHFEWTHCETHGITFKSVVGE